MRYGAASRSANASTICCAVQAPVGCSVTLKCSTLRRSCSSTIKTNNTLMVIVGTVKKSIDTIWPTWLCRKVLHVWVGRTPEPGQDARDSAFGDGEAEHSQFAMNPRCAP